jgi:multidrug efflux system membrane fusion protein
VVTALVETRDVPIYLNGLGNVQGFNTVTIRSRIDGHLEKVVFSEGQEVKAGEILAQIDPRPYQAALDQALAHRKQNEALLTNAKQDLARDIALLAENAGTAQKADSQKALVNQLESSLKADDAAIEAATVQLGYATIRSPISGRAGIRLVDEGNVVRAQDANGIVVITQMQPVSVVFTLTEQNLHAIRTAAEKGPLQVVALGRDNSSLIAEGTLRVIDNQIDSTTGTIRLKATFANETLQLWPGQFVNVRLRVEMRKGATVVPAQVVQYGPQGTYAFVISAENTAEMRPLKLSRVEDGVALIDTGLQAGERVVVDGQYRLQPGAKTRSGEGGKGDGEVRKRMVELGNSKPRP